MRSIVGNAALLKKVYVPKYIFTLSKVTSSLMNLVFSLGALLIVMVVTGAEFTWNCLLIAIPILELYVFCVGLGLLLAASNVFFRDVGNIWNVVTLAWMYMTPIFYDINALDPVLQVWIPKLNPMYMYITQMRSFILGGAGGELLILKGGLVSIIMLGFGLWIFAKTKNRFILYI